MTTSAADFRQQGEVIALSGTWTTKQLAKVDQRLRSIQGIAQFDGSALERLDTAGAWLLVRSSADPDLIGFDEEQRRLIGVVAATVRAADHGQRRSQRPQWYRALDTMGRAVAEAGQDGKQILGFAGLVLERLAQTVLRPSRFRFTPTVHHMQAVGLNAVPIVALLAFMVGAVIAFLGARVLQQFGGEVFVVELIGVAFLREFGPLLTAILVAGRSGSAFTAQIGSMKAREELDAIAAMGLDSIVLLVMPRLVALLIMLPALVLISNAVGLLAGGLVAWGYLDIPPPMYMSRLATETSITHFWVGMVKAPVFAVVIALVGCLEGFKVRGSAASVGEHTTASVVQSIFLVIVLDALFAVFFLEMDW